MKLCSGGLILAMLLAGCGGGGIQQILPSHPGQLLVTDPQLPGGSYYDVWKFVPSRSDRARFRMTSDSLTCQVFLKDGQGNIIGIATASGYDDCGDFDGDVSLTESVVEGQTYTLVTTDYVANETGAYVVWWPTWVQLTSPGN